MIAKMQLWGRRIGAVSLDEGREVAAFQYNEDFARSGIELSPLVMPLSERVYEFPALPVAAAPESAPWSLPYPLRKRASKWRF